MMMYPLAITIGLWRQKRWALYGLLTLLAIPIAISGFVVVRAAFDAPQEVDQEVVRAMFVYLVVSVFIASWFVANKRFFK